MHYASVNFLSNMGEMKTFSDLKKWKVFLNHKQIYTEKGERDIVEEKGKLLQKNGLRSKK